MEPFNRRRDDRLCEPVRGELDRPALLEWLNSLPEFSAGSFFAADALLVGKLIDTPDELRLLVLLNSYTFNTAVYFSFDFPNETLRPFIIEPVRDEQTVAQ